MRKCLDAYALIEIANQNPVFAYLLNEDVVITDITMAEFYGNLYRKLGYQTAEYWYKKMSFFCVPVSRDLLVKAIRLRIDKRKQNLSFFDCVGYTYSVENNLQFVTGDKEFKELPNVEFIKKD